MTKFKTSAHIIIIITIYILFNSCGNSKDKMDSDEIPVLGVCDPCDCELKNEFIFDKIRIGMPISEYTLNPNVDSTHLYFNDRTQGYVYIKPIWGYYHKEKSVVGIEFYFAKHNYETDKSNVILKSRFVSTLWQKWFNKCLEENGTYAEITDNWMRCERLVFSKKRELDGMGVYDACIYAQLIEQRINFDSIKIDKTMDLFNR